MIARLPLYKAFLALAFVMRSVLIYLMGNKKVFRIVLPVVLSLRL